MLGFFRGFNPRLPGRSRSRRRYRDGGVEGIRRSYFARRFPSYSSSNSRPRPSECDDRFVRPQRPDFSQQPGMEQSTVSDKDDSRPQQPSFRPHRLGQQRPRPQQRPGQQGPRRPQRPEQQGPCRPQRPGQERPCRPQRPGQQRPEQQRPRPQQRPEQQRPRPQQRPEQQGPTLGQTVLTQQQEQTVPQEPAVCVEPPVTEPEVFVEPPVTEPEVCVEPPVTEPEPEPEPEVCEPEVSEELEEPEELEESDEYVEPEEPEEPVVPEEPEVEEEELATKLHVTAVDLHYEDNAKEHHTDMYACSKGTEERDAELVLRRGQEFKMTITFDRPYDIKKNDITLMFNLGDEYKPHKGLNASFTVDETGATKYKPNNWGATVTGQEGNSLTLSVFIPATTPIGEWEFAIQTIVDVKDDKNIIWQYNHTADVIDIIFNPWCKEDWVYMEDDVWRTETVLNDHGTQYYGTYNQVGVKAWAYNQFNYGILDTALHLVRKSFGFQATPAMASPVKVSRMIAKIVNSPDDDGVLLGNWSGNYAGGVAPTAWVGSEKILLEYMKTAKPVRYGQCWVFSAVTTAVCRALGLPCRSITNFSSAHNTDLFRLSVDVIKREVGGVIEETKDDFIWNFHVWNEVFMRRPDLNTDAIKYDGWQVIDATPQERSDGVYVCGPAPVVAIKEGHLNVGDDTSFVYAEVNADKVEWTNSNVLNTLVETKRDRYAIGKNISTHKPTGKPYASSSTGNFMTGDDNMEREDLTKCYKYEDGTPRTTLKS
ncbi:annulin-like [Haliotis rufescens]|uniref:annulin-like n=1 Tax=Haliotis rufescens TaxID=6454 RepID=UPI00201EAC55|nr:annulin-like [Haliotis rufescens]